MTSISCQKKKCFSALWDMQIFLTLQNEEIKNESDWKFSLTLIFAWITHSIIDALSLEFKSIRREFLWFFVDSDSACGRVVKSNPVQLIFTHSRQTQKMNVFILNVLVHQTTWKDTRFHSRNLWDFEWMDGESKTHKF